MEKNSKIYVAGHGGLLGSAIVRKLLEKGYCNIVGKRSYELDLTRQKEVDEFFDTEKPEYVFLAAAKVGGIKANDTYPAEFIYDNLQIETNVIHAAYKNQVKKLEFIGSGCVYPRTISQPIKESYLLSGTLEKTNEAYALAKIAGLKMCEFYNKQYGTNFISVLPCNLYGKGDSYHSQNAHVIPALIKKFYNAIINESKEVIIWGSGHALREFIHIDDMADACIFLMENYNQNEWINVGSGSDIPISELVSILAKISGYNGKITYDSSMPDGTPKKLLDSSKLFKLGWHPNIGLQEGLTQTYHDYVNNHNCYREV